MLLLCSPRQQRPLSLILNDLMQVEARITIIILAGERVILRREVAGQRAGQACAIHHITKSRQAKDGQTTMTVTVPQDAKNCKLESCGDSPQAKRPF